MSKAQCIKVLNGILDANAHNRVNGAIASQRSTHAHGSVLRRFFGRLNDLGYKLTDPRNLGHRHIEAMCRDWREQKLSPKTIQGYFSHLRIFCVWIGKDGMLKPITHYLHDVPPAELRVTTIAKESKSWAEAGIDVAKMAELAAQLDWRFGLMILAAVAFGLRRMEVLQMKPWKCDKGDKFAVYATKGGRPRDVYIDTEVQRAVLDLIKSKIKKNEHLGWTQRTDGGIATLEYSERRYMHLMERLGITKALADVTGHGLRAQFAENAALLKSMIPPTLGGTSNQMPRDDLNVLRSQVSEQLGHSRISVTGAYYGSFGREKAVEGAGRKAAIISACMDAIKIENIASIPNERLVDCMRLSNELMTIQVFGYARKAHVLWEHHSRRHATAWLTPSDESNLAALEAAAISLSRSGEASAVMDAQ
jgi:integrase